MVSVLGFSFSGSGQNAALAFVPLKHWDERKGPQHSAQALAGRAFGALSRRARRLHLRPRAAGDPRARHRHRLLLPPQDRGGNGHAALVAARNQLLGMAAQSKVLAGRAPRRPGRRAAAPGRHRPRPRQRARRLVRQHQRACSRPRSARTTSTTSRTPGGCSASSSRPTRRTACSPTTCCSLNVAQQPGQAGAAGGVGDDRAGSPARSRRSASTAIRRCASPAMPRPAISTGDAMDEMERAGRPAARRLRLRVDRPVARGAPLRLDRAILLLGFSLLAVFLCLSALYESWSIPFAVLLAVPLGVLGAVLGATLARHAERRLLQGRPDHRDRPVGEERDPDHRVRQGPARAGHGRWSRRRCEAVHLRFRPILMTSIAFILGVLPLVVSSGAGSAQPARDRHRRDGRDDHRDLARDLLRAGVLRRRAPHLQGRRSCAQLYAACRCRARRRPRRAEEAAMPERAPCSRRRWPALRRARAAACS